MKHDPTTEASLLGNPEGEVPKLLQASHESPDQEGHSGDGGADPPASPEVTRRRLMLARVSVACGAASAAIIGGPIVGFTLAPLFTKATQSWRGVGAKTEFQIGKTVSVTFVDASPLPWAGVTSKTAAWLRRDGEDEFTAFSVNCAHLGCPVRWVDTANLFMCPCHGGVYYADGSVAAGPPPHGLMRYPVRVEAGEVQIHTEPIPIG